MTLPTRATLIPDSPLSIWDGRWKLAAILLAIVGISSLDQLSPAVVALVLALVFVSTARVRFRSLVLKLSEFGIATLPFLIVLPFTLDSAGTAWDLGPVRVYEHGVVVGLAVACRCLAIGALAIALVETAPLHETFVAARSLRIPSLFVHLLMLAHRYLFLLGDEFRRLRIALRLKGFRAKMNRHSYQTLAHATGAILVRGADRADRVAAAMRCRGFDGQFHSLRTFRTTSRDVISFLVVVAATLILVFWDRMGFS